MAEVLVSMFNANVLVLPREKPDFFQADGETSLIDIDQPTYYTSLEIKGGGPAVAGRRMMITIWRYLPYEKDFATRNL